MAAGDICGVQGCGKDARRSLSPPQRNAPVQGEELVAIGEDGLVIAVRSEETDFEVSEHADAPEDRAALHLILARGRLQAREEIVAIREFDEDGVPFASRLHELTESEALPI